MAKKLKVGDRLHGYRITQVFGPGMMAISYAAEGRSGEKVFFKQYKSPAPTVVWYAAFVAYQKELFTRLRSRASTACPSTRSKARRRRARARGMP
jgi:hypothetical protein